MDREGYWSRHEHGSPARLFNAGLGLWLAASTFLWHHDRAPLVNGLATGVAIFVAGVAGFMGIRWARWVTVGLALWLFSATAFVIPYGDGATVFNQLVVAVVALFVSFIPPTASTDAEPGAGMVPH